MKVIFGLLISITLIAGCTTANDVAIQTAHAQARTQECAAVANIAQSGAASEAAVLMAARGCGGGASPKTTTDRMISLAGALAPVAGAAIQGAVAIKQGETSADVQREQIASSTASAAMDADVLKTLGQDTVVEVRPEVVNANPTVVNPEVINAPDPVIIETPGPEVVNPEVINAPDPVIIETPEQQVCSPDENGVLVCQ